MLDKRDAIHTHVFKSGESFSYDYDDTDITYCADLQDGIPVAKNPLSIQQIKIATQTDIQSVESKLTHKITILLASTFREADASKFAEAPFSSLNKLIKNYPTQLVYTYPNESFALLNLFNLFKNALGNPNFMADPVAQILFF